MIESTAPKKSHLVFLAAFALLLDLLLFLELLGDPGLAQRLALAALVGLGVEGRLQRGVPAHADHHLLPELRGGGTKSKIEKICIGPQTKSDAVMRCAGCLWSPVSGS